MKYRSLILYAAVLLVFSAAAFAAFRINAGKHAAPQETEEEIFPSFAPDQVTGIEIAYDGGKTPSVLKMEIREGRWIILTSENAAASRAAVTEFLSALSRTKPVREIRSPDEETLKELNLSTNPEFSPGSGLGVRLKLTCGGKRDITMFFGKAHVKHEDAETALTGRRIFDGRYVRVDEHSGRVHVYLITRVFRNCVPAPHLWLEPLCLQSAGTGVYRFACASLDEKGKEIPVWSVMPNMSLRNFELVYPAGAVLSMQELAKRLEMLTTPFSRGLLPSAEAEKIRFGHVIHLDTKDGFSGKLYLAELPDGRAAAKLESDWRIQRRKDETEEAFQHRKLILEARADDEKKAFHGRTFLVSPEMVSQMIKVPAGTPRHSERKKDK